MSTCCTNKEQHINFILFLSDTSNQQIYYLSINVTNSASKDATLKWTGVAGDEELDVLQQGSNEKEIAVTSSSLPEALRVQAVEKGTSNPLIVNGMSDVSVPYSLVKQTTDIVITEGMLFAMLLIQSKLLPKDHVDSN